jgi:hypothetical protein
MSDVFDQLEAQLRRGLRAAPTTRQRYRRGRKRTAALALAATLVVSAGALAAVSHLAVSHHHSPEVQGRELALQAVRETAQLPACVASIDSSAGPELTDSRPLREITDLLPALAKPVPAGERTQTLAKLGRIELTGGPLLATTVRTVSLQEHVRLLVYVQQGIGLGALRDPATCGRLRLARAMVLSRDSSPVVQRWARWRLAQMRDIVPGVQTLGVFESRAGEPGGGGTAGSVRPGQPLRPGLRGVSGYRDGSRLFVGVAAPQTTHVLVKTPPAGMRGYPRKVRVREGFYAVILPKGVGPFRLLEVDADGRTRSIELRQ